MFFLTFYDSDDSASVSENPFFFDAFQSARALPLKFDRLPSLPPYLLQAATWQTIRRPSCRLAWENQVHIWWVNAISTWREI